MKLDYGQLNMKVKKKLGEGGKAFISRIIFPWRNKFCLYNIFKKAKKNKVNLNYWSESANLGDALAPIILNHMLEQRNIDGDKPVSKTKHLYAVGSVLTAGIQDCTVWGSGVLNATLLYRLKKRKFDIRAVRGPVTRAILLDYGYNVPEVYGDPAILLPEIYTPEPCPKKAKYGVILHKDYIIPTRDNELAETIFIDIRTENYKLFVEQLMSVNIVISSSLHGIILAESYGIPAILLKPQVDILKYYDYYYSTGRTIFPIASDIAEAKKIVPAELPDLTQLKTALKISFPYDLYE